MVLIGVFTLMGGTLSFFFLNLNVDEALNFTLSQWRAVTTRCCFQKNNCSFFACCFIHLQRFLIFTVLPLPWAGWIHITPAQQRCFSWWKPLNSAESPFKGLGVHGNAPRVNPCDTNAVLGAFPGCGCPASLLMSRSSNLLLNLEPYAANRPNLMPPSPSLPLGTRKCWVLLSASLSLAAHT